LVVAAVFAELVIVGIHPPYDSSLNKWGSALADASIALGIVGEVLFSRLDARIQTELRSRSNKELAAAVQSAARANERAAEAQLQLANFRSARTLTRDQMYRIAEKMKPFAPLTFDAAANPGSAECVQCLRFIEVALGLAGWKQRDFHAPGLKEDRRTVGLPTIGLQGSVSNVAIFFLVDDSEPSYAEAAGALADALMAEGIIAEARPTFGIEHELGGPKAPTNITVGPKT
jgi:hypothetical protein